VFWQLCNLEIDKRLCKCFTFEICKSLKELLREDVIGPIQNGIAWWMCLYKPPPPSFHLQRLKMKLNMLPSTYVLFEYMKSRKIFLKIWHSSSVIFLRGNRDSFMTFFCHDRLLAGELNTNKWTCRKLNCEINAVRAARNYFWLMFVLVRNLSLPFGHHCCPRSVWKCWWLSVVSVMHKNCPLCWMLKSGKLDLQWYGHIFEKNFF
jgi:hypothetical protein